MANDTDMNPLRIDTALSLQRPLTVIAMAWVEDAATTLAADNDLIIRRGTEAGAGDEIFNVRAETDNERFIQQFPGGWKFPGDGFNVTIDGGVLYLWTT